MREFVKRVLSPLSEARSVSQVEYREAIRRLENAGEESLYKAYTILEDQLYDSVLSFSTTFSSNPDIPYELRVKLKSNYLDNLIQNIDNASNGMLEPVNPRERKRVQTRALSEARSYWEGRLTEKVIPADIITFGRRRVAQLDARLEGLNRPYIGS